MDVGVAVFLVHFGGNLDEQGDNYAYIGGKTHFLTLPYTSGFNELLYAIHDRIGTTSNETRMEVKCQVPIGKFMKPIIIDIRDDVDFKSILEMFKNSTISVGMLYVTKLKPIEDTQPNSTSMPSSSLSGYNFARTSPETPLHDYQTVDAQVEGSAPKEGQHNGLHELSNVPRVQNKVPQLGASDHTRQGEVSMHTVEVPNEELISSNVEARENVLDDDIIRIGQSFSSVQQFKTALRDYAIRNNFEYRTGKSSKSLVVVTCRSEGCSWRIRASLDCKGKFTIKSTSNLKHKCNILAPCANHKQTNSLWIAEKMIDAFRAQPSMNIRSIQAYMMENWRIKINYSKAHMAKEKMLDMVNGQQLGEELVANPPSAKRRVGRPKSNGVEKLTTACALCNQLGHNKRTCKNTAPQPVAQTSSETINFL